MTKIVSRNRAPAHDRFTAQILDEEFTLPIFGKTTARQASMSTSMRSPDGETYQPCPGLATGGRPLRKSACWRWDSLSWSASRACCSGLGP